MPPDPAHIAEPPTKDSRAQVAEPPDAVHDASGFSAQRGASASARNASGFSAQCLRNASGSSAQFRHT
eukprot:2096782-Alexandrium_andersonii.AAC.1